MEQQKKNKEFIIQYFNAISGVDKTWELLEAFTEAEKVTPGLDLVSAE